MIFWRCVAILELTCSLKVIAVTCDGASENCAFHKMFKAYTDDAGKEVIYRTLNLFSPEKRFIWLFCDAPHLLKTARNCLANSGSHRNSRLMWKDGSFIMWSHISKLYFEDRECGLQILSKSTIEHISLIPYSVMRVRLAAQILSETVGSVLSSFAGQECKETANFCLKMDKFSDCTNVRITKEHLCKGKPHLKPYEKIDDGRF